MFTLKSSRDNKEDVCRSRNKIGGVVFEFWERKYKSLPFSVLLLRSRFFFSKGGSNKRVLDFYVKSIEENKFSEKKVRK